MLLGARQFFERRGALTPPLPYDAEVQYLQSTGTQYIDTGIYCLGKYSFEFDISCPFTGQSYEDWFGGSSADSQRGFRFRRQSQSSGTVLFSVGGKYTPDNSTTMTVGARHRIIIDGPSYSASIDGVAASLTLGGRGAFDTSVRLFLFAYSRNNSPYRNSVAKVHSFKCYDGDALVQDLIPVRVGTTGYMYDRVSGTLFGNDGTGAFLYGPDVTPAFGYVQNGLIAMWDGIENAGWGVHDAAAATWKDLVGNGYDLDIYGSVEPNCVRTTSTSAAGMSGTISGIATIECCCKINPTQSITIGPLAYSGNINTTNLGLVRYSPVGFQTYIDVFWDYPAVATESARTVSATTSACYVDGVGLQVASHSADAWNNGSYTGIGGRHWQSHSYRSVGDYYCVRIYNRALTAAEIAENYAIDKARFNLP